MKKFENPLSLMSIVFILTVFICSFFLLSCISSDDDDDVDIDVGGPCEYADVPGTATIVSITDAGSDLYNCDIEPVEVLFDFIPDNPDETSESSLHLTVGSGLNPSRNQMIDKGIVVGGTYKFKRMEITKGTCTPTIYAPEDIDLSDYADFCWE